MPCCGGAANQVPDFQHRPEAADDILDSGTATTICTSIRAGAPGDAGRPRLKSRRNAARDEIRAFKAAPRTGGASRLPLRQENGRKTEGNNA